jgi:cellulose synthase operon protein C
MRPGLRTIALWLALSAWPTGRALAADSFDEQFAQAADHYSQQQWQAACDGFAALLSSDIEPARAAEVRFYYGESLAQLERWQEARAQFAQLLKADPQHAFARQALYRSAEAAHHADDLNTAKKELESFRQRFPKDKLNAFVLCYLADIEFQTGHAEAGEKLCRATIADFPESPQAESCRLWLAECQEQRGELDQAASELKSLAGAGGPLMEQAWLRLGTLENRRGQYPAAIAALDHISADSPLNNEAQLAHGFALFKQQNYDEAEAQFAAMANEPKVRVEARYWLGLCKSGRKDFLSAAQTLVAAGKLEFDNPLNPSIAFAAAEAFTAADKTSEAQQQLDLILNRWADSSIADAALYAKLRLATSANDHEGCLRLAGQFAARYAKSPLAPQVLLIKGQALAKLDRHADAAEAFSGVLKLTPPPEVEAVARVWLGLALVRSGQKDEAKAALNELPPAVADKGEIQLQAAEVLASAGDLERAAERFSALAKRELSPELSVLALMGVACTRFDLHQSAESLAACRELLAKYPQSQEVAEAALLAGQILERDGDPTAARAMYQTVYDQHPESRFAGEALLRAARLFDAAKQPLPAIELYQRILDAHPESPDLGEVIYRLAWLHQEQGHTAQSDAMFERLERDFPKSPFVADALLHHADRALAAGKLVEASNLVSQIDLADASPTLRQNILLVTSRISIASERWAEAEQRLKELLATGPSPKAEMAARFQLATSVYFQHRYAEAVEQFKELADRTSNDPPQWAMAQLQRAKALAQLRQWAEALEVAQSIAPRCENFAGMHEADYLIGRAFVAQADFDAARGAYARVLASPAVQKTEIATLAQCMIGESYFHQENYQAALDAYLKAERDHAACRWTPSALVQAGKCCEALGRWQDAERLYERFLQGYPAHPLRADIAQRLTVARQRAAKETSKLK